MPTPVAPLVAAFRRRLANLPGPGARAGGEASNGEPVVVELLVAGQWVDLTADGYVLVRDDNGKIAITYGIQGGVGSQTERGRATLQLKNPDGRFSPRNPTGPYFGLLNWRNAQMRVSVPDGNGGKCYLIWGEVSEWAPNWDTSGNDVWVDVTINGILQRLAQEPAPERSIIYRAVTDPDLTGLVAYWPCEDPTSSVQLASALTTGSAMTWTGNPELAAYEGFGASDSLPTLTGASLTGGVARYDTTSGQHQTRYLLAVPKVGFSDLDVVSRIQVVEPSSGALVGYFDVHYNAPAGGVGSYGGTGTLTLLIRDGDEAELATSGTSSISLDVRGRLLRVSVEVSQSGANIAATLRVLDVDSGITDSAAIGLVTATVTRVLAVSMGPATLSQSAGLTGAAVGHITVQTTITDVTDLGRAIQPAGEAAGRRIQRLCAEEGVAFGWIGDLDDTVALGPQGKQNLVDLVQEATLADGGFLYESTDGMGLGYRTRASLYGQDAALVLSYTGVNLAEIPVPVSDDRYVQNRVTVTVNGVSQTYEETGGALGTSVIGVYGEKDGVTLNLATTDQATLLDQAAWRVALGTVEDERFPQISVNLAHPSITPELKRAILALRLGDRMQINGMPGWLAPDAVDQLILGKDQTVNHFLHQITFTCAPASPYTGVANLDSVSARIDIDGSEILSAVSAGATSIDVIPSGTNTMLWSTDTADLPFSVRAGGEVMTVTAVTPSVNDTFTRTTANGWGTANTGQVWTLSGGAAGDHYTQGSEAAHQLTSINTSRFDTVTVASADVDLRADFATDALAAGGPQYTGLVARFADTNNLYYARLAFSTTQTVQVVLQKRVGAAQSDLATVVATELTHAAFAFFTLRFRVIGATLMAKAWPRGGVEPGAWHVTATDGSLSAPGSVGVRSILDSLNTNVLPVITSVDNFQLTNVQTLTVTRAVNGVSKAQAAGEDIRLATYTPVAL